MGVGVYVFAVFAMGLAVLFTAVFVFAAFFDVRARFFMARNLQ
jgi:hypothetical protein